MRKSVHRVSSWGLAKLRRNKQVPGCDLVEQALSDEPTTLLVYQAKSLLFPRDLDFDQPDPMQMFGTEKRQVVNINGRMGEWQSSDIQPPKSHPICTVISSFPRHLVSTSSPPRAQGPLCIGPTVVAGSRPGSEDHPKTVQDGNPGSLVQHQVLGKRYGSHVYHLLLMSRRE
jgi:hypothetical protein